MKKLLLCACAALLFCSCGVVKAPLAGAIYTDVKGGESVTSNSGSTKVGTAKATAYVGLIALGDASIQEAAKSAGITRIHHVDYHSTTILGLYSTYTTVVYGE